jgi:aminopeptidase N
MKTNQTSKFLTAGLILYLVSLQVARSDGYHRVNNLDVLHYEFAVSLNDSTDVIEGNAVVILKLKAPADSVSFDLAGPDGTGKGISVKSVRAGDKETGWKQDQAGLQIYATKSGTFHDTLKLTISYSGIPKDGLIISRNKFGDRTFFADHWPDRAHNYLPCIDHPSDKATVDFIITAPEQYNVVANGILIEQSSISGKRKVSHWRENVPLPVKVMTFGVARFAVRYEGEADGVQLSTWVYPQNRVEGFNDYAVAIHPLEYYQKLIGNYPFEKLANVQSKTIYGGLENAGAIFYSENSVTGKGRDEGLMAHEIAHQWFGDCITEDDWFHIWLSEGFATYLTSMYMESVYGEERLKADMSGTRETVLRYYKLHPAPVIDTTVTDLMELLNTNSYQKGGWILHMLRYEMGDENFKKGLRLFYTRFANSNVLSSDFQNVMEEASGRDLSGFFRQWLWIAGQPELKISKRQSGRSGTSEIIVEQLQKELFDFNLELLIRCKDGEHFEKFRIRDRKTQLVLPYKDIVEIKADPWVRLLFRMED